MDFFLTVSFLFCSSLGLGREYIKSARRRDRKQQMAAIKRKHKPYSNIHYPTFQRLPKSFYLNETDPVGTEVFKVYLWFIIILDQPVSE